MEDDKDRSRRRRNGKENRIEGKEKERKARGKQEEKEGRITQIDNPMTMASIGIGTVLSLFTPYSQQFYEADTVMNTIFRGGK
jgi:hypothetical protein